MSASAFVGLIALAWVVLIAVIVAIFHGWRWIDHAVDDELNQVFSVRGGAHGPPGIGEQREQ